MLFGPPIITRELGPGKEKESVLLLKEINPDARPNKLMVWLTDEMLSDDNRLTSKQSVLSSRTGLYGK